jgi:hypothetical protein
LDGELTTEEIRNFEHGRRIKDLVLYTCPDFEYKLDVLDTGKYHLQFCLNDPDNGKFTKRIVLDALDVLVQIEYELKSRGCRYLFMLMPNLENKIKIMSMAGFTTIQECTQEDGQVTWVIGRREL